MRTTHRIPTLATQAAACLLLVLLLLWGGATRGQEESKYYNIKAGPVRFILTAGMSTEYNDNINLSSGLGGTPIQSDIILNPHFSIDAVSELQILPKSQTDITTIGFTINLGTKRYLQNPELSQDDSGLTIAPDSELSFLIRTGHFKTRLYDQFSLEDDPSADGTLSNVAVFRRFKNIAGVKTTWDVNSKTSLSWGYEHGNLVALQFTSLSGTSPSLNSLDNSTDQVFASGFCQIFSLLGVGASASAMSTTYPDNPGQNMTNYNYGPFLEARFTQYTTLNASYSRSESQEGSFFDGGNDSTGFNSSSSNSKNDNFTVTLTNHMNKYYTHSLSLGRQTQFNILGNLTVFDRLIYTSVWTVNSKIALSSSIFVEDATDVGGVNANPYYKRYGCTLGTSYRLSRKMTTTLDYRFSKKVSDEADQSYKQNMLTWSINYAF